MNVLSSIIQGILEWSVQRKLTIVSFLGVAIFPMATFIILQTKGVADATHYLIGLIVVSIILMVPFSKFLSHILAIRFIRELNDHCQLLKEGNYSEIELPEFKAEENDFLKLKRNMHWMGYSIATREQKLQKAMTDLATAQRQIGESIEYASLIQTSFLPDRVALYDYIPNHFLIWEQRDTVGGDAYWLKPTDTGFFIGVIDCTGHGVPGAFMTLIVTSLLEKAAADGTDSPADILGRMNTLIKDALGQNDRDAQSDDGMDCALCHVNKEAGTLTFAGANTPLFVLEQDGVRTIKGDRCGLGYVRSDRQFSFTDHPMKVGEGVRFYLATDGLVDQVGGEMHFPFGRRRFMEYMEARRNSPIAEQGVELMAALREFQGDEVRRDDVTVIGFEL